MNETIEKYETKKEIMQKRSRLHYIQNREKIIEKSKIRSKKKRKPWSERADNPNNKNKKYYPNMKVSLFKNFVYFSETEN